MKKIFATFLALMSLNGAGMEVTASYDYFRGLPEGNWNGNTGIYLAGNMGVPVLNCVEFQAGTSFGIYNWEGRSNIVFHDDQNSTYQGYATTGFVYRENQYTLGVVYDYLYTNHFGIYDLSPSLMQVRGKLGYKLGSTELGVWATTPLNTSEKSPHGIETRFRAVSQANVYLTQKFSKTAQGTFWIGTPYESGLMSHHTQKGNIIAGFNGRALLCAGWLLDVHGSYMTAHKHDKGCAGKNYAASLTVGVTYRFGDRCQELYSTWLPLADNSQFLIDTNGN
jgi:hypothetical protein